MASCKASPSCRNLVAPGDDQHCPPRDLDGNICSSSSFDCCECCMRAKPCIMNIIVWCIAVC